MRAILVESTRPLPSIDRTVIDDLARWAGERPAAAFLAERDGDSWRSRTYAEMHADVMRLAAPIAALSLHRPVLIVAANSIDHATLMFAAMAAGVAIVPVSPIAARSPNGVARLTAIIASTQPELAFTDDERIAERLRDIAPALTIIDRFDGFPRGAGASAPAAEPDRVAKILFTSGSTGVSRGVITTHRMLRANQAQLADALGPIAPPIVLDWLPWNHCYGGSLVVNFVLHSGGTLYIDNGAPVHGRYERTVRNLDDVRPTIRFDVPRGHSMLVAALEQTPKLAAAFERCAFIYSAGATLPATVRARLQRALEGLPVPSRIIESWGATETAPLATIAAPGNETSGAIGLPVAGCTIRLTPHPNGYAAAVRGPNVTPGYHGTDAGGPDADGFIATGDLLAFVDPSNRQRGLRFMGRTADQFKLSSAVWVDAAALRDEIVDVTRSVVSDAAIAGEGRDDVRALLFVGPERARDDAFIATLSAALAPLASPERGSAARLVRARVITDSPSAETGELTDKGTLNGRRSLALRAADVERLYGDEIDDATIPLAD